MIRQLPEQITNDRWRCANSDSEWTRTDLNADEPCADRMQRIFYRLES